MKQMKIKNLILILIFLLVITTGCGKEKTTTDNTKSTNNQGNNSSQKEKKQVSEIVTIKIGEAVEAEIYEDDEEGIFLKYLFGRTEYPLEFPTESDIYGAVSDYIENRHSNFAFKECVSALGNNYEAILREDYKSIVGLEKCVQEKYDAHNEGIDPESYNYLKYEYIGTYIKIAERENGGLSGYFTYKNTTFDKEKDFIVKLVEYGIPLLNKEEKNVKYYATIYPITYKGKMIDFCIYVDIVPVNSLEKYEQIKKNYEEKAKQYPKTYIDNGMYKRYIDDETNISLYNNYYSKWFFKSSKYLTKDIVKDKEYDFYEYMKEKGVEDTFGKNLIIKDEKIIVGK